MTPDLFSTIVLSVFVFYLQWTQRQQERFFLGEIQTLVDKLKSQSFESYTRAMNPPPPRVTVTDEIPEDLRGLDEFSAV